jgi:predicted Zn-ribbon and HTH transcriptional regulator
MFRKDLLERLRERAWTLSSLARELELPKREVEDDLEHLLRSIRRGPERAVITPGACRSCGFTFGQERLRKPGKCLSCRGTWVSEPTIQVESRQ